MQVNNLCEITINASTLAQNLVVCNMVLQCQKHFRGFFNDREKLSTVRYQVSAVMRTV